MAVWSGSVRSVDVSGRSGPGLPRLTPLVPIAKHLPSRSAGDAGTAGPARRAGTADRRRQRLPCPLLPRLLIWPDGGQASQDCARLYLLLRPHSAPARRKPCTSAAPPRAWTLSCRRTDMQRGGLTNSSVLGGSGRPRVRGRGAPADFVRGAGRGAPISSGPRARGAGRRYRLGARCGAPISSAPRPKPRSMPRPRRAAAGAGCEVGAQTAGARPRPRSGGADRRRRRRASVADNRLPRPGASARAY